jgi:hypothetical protein
MEAVFTEIQELPPLRNWEATERMMEQRRREEPSTVENLTMAHVITRESVRRNLKMVLNQLPVYSSVEVMFKKTRPDLSYDMAKYLATGVPRAEADTANALPDEAKESLREAYKKACFEFTNSRAVLRETEDVRLVEEAQAEMKRAYDAYHLARQHKTAMEQQRDEHREQFMVSQLPTLPPSGTCLELLRGIIVVSEQNQICRHVERHIYNTFGCDVKANPVVVAGQNGFFKFQIEITYGEDKQ